MDNWSNGSPALNAQGLQWDSDSDQSDGENQKVFHNFFFEFSKDLVNYDEKSGSPFVVLNKLLKYKSQIESTFEKHYGSIFSSFEAKFCLLELCKGDFPPEKVSNNIVIRGSLSSKNDLELLVNLIRSSRYSGRKVLVPAPLFERTKLQKQLCVFKTNMIHPMQADDIRKFLIIKEEDIRKLGHRELMVRCLAECANVTPLEALKNDRDLSVIRDCTLHVALSGRCPISIAACTFSAAVINSNEQDKLCFLLKVKSHVEAMSSTLKTKGSEQINNQLAAVQPNTVVPNNNPQNVNPAGGKKGGGKNANARAHTYTELHSFLRGLSPQEKKVVACPFGANCNKMSNCQYSHEDDAFTIAASRPLNEWLSNTIRKRAASSSNKDNPNGVLKKTRFADPVDADGKTD